MDIDDSEETQADRDRAGGIDITGYDRDYTYIADLCLGRLNIARHAGNECGVRRCSGFWFVYNGKVFERCDSERMATLIRPILDLCWYNKPVGKDSFQETDLNPTSSTVNEVLVAMTALPGVLADEEPDQNEDELVCLNGRVDLHTGKLSPHSAAVFATRMVQLELPEEESFELAETHVQWIAYLDSLELGAPTLEYLRRAFGYALTGRGCEKAFFFLHGEKNTSKTTLLRLVMDVVGRTANGGYAADTECLDWLDRGSMSTTHTDSLMGIEGARLVFGDETGENARFNEARIKRAVGGTGSALRMSAKGEKGRDVPIRFGLFFSSNHLPSTQDNATQDRLKLITHTKVVENPDPSFQRKFMTPLMRRVVLAWLVGAAGDYLKNGLGIEPPSVLIAREEYALDNDWFGTFLRERIGRRVNLWQDDRPIKSSTIGAELARWSKELGLRQVIGPNRLPRMIEKRTALKSRKLHGCRVFDGLALRYDSDGLPHEGVVDLELVEP